MTETQTATCLMQWLNSRLMQEQKYIQKLHGITLLPFILYSMLSFCPSSLRSYEALRLTRSRQWKRLPCLRSSKERWSCTDTGGGICEAWWLVVHILAKAASRCKAAKQHFKSWSMACRMPKMPWSYVRMQVSERIQTMGDEVRM